MAWYDREAELFDEAFLTSSDSDEFDEGFGEAPPARSAAELWRAAAAAVDVEAMRRLLSERADEIDADRRASGDWTALMYAADAGDPLAVAFLLERGARPDAAVEGVAPLACACSAGPKNRILARARCVKLLLRAGALPDAADNHPDSTGRTLLIRAIESEDTLLVEWLSMLVDVNAKDKHRMTAADFALMRDCPEELELLFYYGADLQQLSPEAIAIAQERNNRALKTLYRLRPELVEPEEQTEEEFQYIYNWFNCFPGVFPSDDPPFFYEVHNILQAIGCNTLLKTFHQANVSLQKLLSISNEEATKLIMFPYQRRRLLAKIRDFHLHNWNLSVLPRTEKVKGISTLTILEEIGSHLKHLTIVLSSLNYVNKMLKAEILESAGRYNRLLNDMNTNYDLIRSVITKHSRPLYKQISKCNRPPGDLIEANSLKNKTYIIKNIFIICSVTIFFSMYIIKKKVS